MAPLVDKLEAKFKGLFQKDKTIPTSTPPVASGSSEAAPPDPLPVANSSDITPTSQSNPQPTFNIKDVVVVFVLGGPGAGKGTQCAKLVDDFKFTHLSAGDLLRAEQKRENSPYGTLIQNYIKEGKIVPMEVTIKLLENAMTEDINLKSEQGTTKERSRFLIDGFPRKMDQAVQFEETVCTAALILFLTCPENVLLERLMERGKTSGREDDNEESIKKRFKTFVDTSMPVVEYYRKEGKVAEVESVGTIDDVYSKVKEAVQAVL